MTKIEEEKIKNIIEDYKKNPDKALQFIALCALEDIKKDSPEYENLYSKIKYLGENISLLHNASLWQFIAINL